MMDNYVFNEDKLGDIYKKTLKGKLDTTDFLNAYTQVDYLYRLKEYAINCFEWVNLPDTVDARFIENELFDQGRINFFKDRNLGYLCLPVNESGPINIYNEPTKKEIYASDGFRRTRNISNSVTIYNNFLRTPTFTTINLYAIRLAEVQRTIDINMLAQKTPVTIICPENERLAFKNIYKQVTGNKPVIWGTSELNLDNYKVLDTKSPYVIDKLTLYKHDLWNEAMTFLGVNNANQDKKERLVESEVGANDEQIEQARFNMLDARKLACKKINEMFGLDIDVKFRNDDVQKAYELNEIYEMFPDLKDEGVVEEKVGEDLE